MVDRMLQFGGGAVDHGNEKRMIELATNDGADLGDVLDRPQPVQAGEQGCLQGLRDLGSASPASSAVFVNSSTKSGMPSARWTMASWVALGRWRSPAILCTSAAP